MKLNFLFPLIGLASGIFISSEVTEGLIVASFSLAVALLAWIATIILSRIPSSGYKMGKLNYIWVSLLFLSVGSIDFYSNSSIYLSKEINNQTLSFIGSIEEVKYLADGERFKVRVSSIKDSLDNPLDFRNLNLLVKTDGYLGSKGDIISFTAKATKPDAGRRNNSYYSRLRHQGIEYFVNLKFSEINKVGEKSTLVSHLQRFREHLTILVENSSLDRETGDFVISLILGNKSFLSSDTRTTLTSVGLSHILALSGLHVAILYSFLLFLLFPLSLMGLSMWRKVIAIAVIWLYVLFTGGSPSTVRAALMATFVVGAYIMERKNSALNALLAATLIILLVNPFSLWDIGLQLSFFCVASILVFVSKFNPIDQHLHNRTHKCVNVILITLVTTFCTWVLIAYYFGSIPLSFLPANILLLPLLPVFMSVAIIYLLCLAFGFDPLVMARVLDSFYSMFIGSADFLSFNQSNLNINLPVYSLILWLIGILTIAYAINSDRRNYRKISALCGIILLFSSISFIFLQQKETVNSIRFIHSFTKFEAHVNADAQTSKFVFPRKNISKLMAEGIKIISIDNIILNDSLQNIKEDLSGNKHFVYVGSGAEIAQVADLLASSKHIKVILHSGVGKNKKVELLHLIDPSLWENVYSLRENGSLEFPL